jgi:hypothetical protein
VKRGKDSLIRSLAEIVRWLATQRKGTVRRIRINEGRNSLEQLMGETGISRQERDGVLTAFDALRQGIR